MSIFDQMIRGGYAGESALTKDPNNSISKRRTFKETIGDQIAYHQSKIKELQDVKDSLTPEVEKFVEAIQKLG